jgi:hypothetical protein
MQMGHAARIDAGLIFRKESFGPSIRSVMYIVKTCHLKPFLSLPPQRSWLSSHFVPQRRPWQTREMSFLYHYEVQKKI